jgi:hypothetical protein
MTFGWSDVDWGLPIEELFAAGAHAHGVGCELMGVAWWRAVVAEEAERWGVASSRNYRGAFSADSRFFKYHSTVLRRPSSNFVVACQLSSRSALLASTRRRG